MLNRSLVVFLFVATLICLPIHSVLASNNFPPVLDIGVIETAKHPGKFALVWRDATCKLNPITDAITSWQPSRAEVPNFGYSHDCNWLWFKLTNSSSKEVNKILHIEKFHINQIQVKLRRADGSVTDFGIAGADYPFSNRVIKHRHYLYPLQLLPGETIDVWVMLRNNGGTISAPISILDSETLHANDTVNILGMGFMSGLMGLIAVFNLLVYFSIRDKVYLYYSLYTFSILLVIVSNQGYLFQYVWPSMPWMANFSRAFLAMAILASFIRLGQHFLGLKQHYPRLNQFLHWVGYMALLMVVLAALFQDYQWARRGFIWSMQAISLIVPVMLGVAFMLYYRRREWHVMVYIIAFAPAIFYLISLNLLIANGLMPINEFYFYGMYAFIIFEVLVLSTFLVINLKRIAQEKNELLLQLNNEQSRRFSVALEASESERKRIARELHDGLGQLLSTAKLYISGFDEVIKKQDTEHREVYENSLRIIDDATTEVRHISHNLMPSSLIQLGLGAAIQGLARQLNGAGELKVWAEVDANIPRLPETVEISVYRIAQEIVNNILKHAKAKNIWMKLIYNESSLTLHMKDDGIGMDTTQINQGAGIGWSNIFSRVTMLKGDYQIYSEKGKGTIIEITVNPAQHG